MSRRTALVSGGGTGIGRATAEALCSAGYDLTIVGRRREVVDRTASEIAALSPGATIRALSIDLLTSDGPSAMVDDHVAHFGGIDALVYCAGVYEPRRFEAIDSEHWASAVDSTLRGAALASAAACRHMLEGTGGRIVLISSVNGFHSEPESGAYSAAKAAIPSLVRSIAVDLAGRGIMANSVSPGWVRTDMTADFLDATTSEKLLHVSPLGRAGRPEELANVIRYLVVDAPEFLTGANLYVDGGQTAMAPFV